MTPSAGVAAVRVCVLMEVCSLMPLDVLHFELCAAMLRMLSLP